MPTTTYMSLLLPSVEITIGPLWASMLNDALDDVDAHDHMAGRGKQVPSGGINVNADLPFNGYNATTLKSVRLSSQGATLVGVADLGCMYRVGNDLYYNNASGVAVRIVAGAAIDVAALNSNVFPQRSVSADTIIGAADAETHFSVDCSVANRLVTLPSAAAVTAGRYYIVSDELGSLDPSTPRTLTVAAAGADGIDGGATITLRTPRAAVVLIRTGSSTWKAFYGERPDKLNAANVPVAGALVTGNTLQVNGTASLAYGALNLAGGANYVTGVLPAANLSLNGVAGSLSFTAAGDVNINFTNTIGGAFDITGQGATVGAGGGVTVTAGTTTAAAAAGGNLALRGGTEGAGGLSGAVRLMLSGNETMVEASEVAAGRRVVALARTAAVTATQMPVNTGDGVVYLANAQTVPTDSPVSGVTLYSNAGVLGIRNDAASAMRIELPMAFSTTTPTNGGGSAPPALPDGYMTVLHNGSLYKIALYRGT